MWLKWLFDKFVAFIGLALLWPVLFVVAILVKVKMPGGPAFLCRRGLVRVESCLSAIRDLSLN